MVVKDTSRDELVRAFGQVVGVEKAEDLVENAVAELGIEDEDVYSTEDIIDICDLIERREEGYLAILAADLQVQKQSERRFNALLENIPDPTVVVRFDAEEPVIKTVNTAFERTFGYGLEEVQGRSLPSLILPDELHDEGRKLDPEQLSSDRIEREVRRETSDGEIRNFLVRSMPVSTMSGDVEAAIIHTDITDRIRREQELERQNERLEQFASVISHDLRNPLSVAMGRLTIVREEVDDEEHVDVVANALDRMRRMIDEILALARQGQAVGETTSVSIASQVDLAWESVQRDEATIEADSDLPTIAADPHRLQEALENLFRNAIEHGGEGVAIRVGSMDGGFFVADDGPGIPDEDRGDVFEQGFTTDPTGTGFGLAIVKNIVEAHGWSIAVTESQDAGARFEIHVPELG